MPNHLVPVLLFLITLAFTGLGQQTAAEPESRISEKEAAELFRSVDEILKFASQATGLAKIPKIERKLSSRDDVEKYVIERMAEDEDQQRLERSELVLKKFGLLPRNFSLRPFIVSLLREQVAGFYDSKRKTVYLSDWLSAEAQKPVLAHELTHALQDEAIDLEAWMKKAKAESRNRSGAQSADAEYDEQAAARTALVEGQGMLVLLEYMLKPMGRSVEDSPYAVKLLQKSMEETQPDSLSSRAPLLIKEGLVFPYREGLGFVHALLQRGGKKAAFAEALSRPPQNTREVLSPNAYFSAESIATPQLPDLSQAIAPGYGRYDVGSVGDFDIRLLGKQFGQAAIGESLAPHWRGGIYYAARKHDCKGATTQCIAFVYLSRWSSPATAKQFAAFYSGTVAKRYAKSKMKGSTWQTDEGAVRVDVQGNSVVAYESFGEQEQKRIAQALHETAEPSNSVAKLAVPHGNLSLRPLAPIYATHLEMWH